MKSFKKLTALLLTIAMVIVMGLSMGMNAQAAEKVVVGSGNSSISVNFVSEVEGTSIPVAGSTEATYYFDKEKTVTAHDAIVASANKIAGSENAVVEGSTDTYKYIDGIFGLNTENHYGTNSWTGKYWKIIIEGLDTDGESVTFESSLYASQIPLGESVTFDNIYNADFTSVTCQVTGITMKYVQETMTW